MAYDLEAAVYDTRLEGDAWMRALLWDRYRQLFSPGSLVLDLGCGTGIDALYLAANGIRVLGIDASPGMIDRARSKLAATSQQAMVDLRVMNVDDLGSLPAAHFDGIISAFASLSPLPDLAPLSAAAARVLRPRGRALLHLLNRWSLWEGLELVRRRRFGALRRLSAGRRNFVVGERIVRHYLWHGREAYHRFFAGQFSLAQCYGLGIFRPPHTHRRIPSTVVGMLGDLEGSLRAQRPFVDWGRFFVLELEKRTETD